MDPHISFIRNARIPVFLGVECRPRFFSPFRMTGRGGTSLIAIGACVFNVARSFAMLRMTGRCGDKGKVLLGLENATQPTFQEIRVMLGLRNVTQPTFQEGKVLLGLRNVTQPTN
jgi:hypothetical protein